MAKLYVKDIRDKDHVKGVFQVGRWSPTSSKAGKPFVAVVLRDKTGELDARVWDKAEQWAPQFAKGDLVEVEGPLQSFQGRPQLRIDAIAKVDPATQDAADFAPPPKAHGEDRAYGQIVEMAERLQDPHLKALLHSFLDDEAFAADFKRAPAAKSVHHAWHGGLCEHTLSVMKLAVRIAEQYPMVDRELMIAGAFLHDVGKLRELSWERATEYTDEGRLVGHLVITAQLIHEKAAKIEGFPKALETHLVHIALAHHGSLEFGSPCLPQTLEAMLVHYIDELDSRVAGWLEIMQRDQGENWTDYQKLYDRHLYKGASPTIHGKAPVERRHRKGKRGGEKQDRAEKGEQQAPAAAGPAPEAAAEPGAAPAAGAQQPAAGEAHPPSRPPREGREPRAERRERPPKPEAKLTFKPFAALAGPAEATPEPEQHQAAPESAPVGESEPRPEQAEAPQPSPEGDQA